MPKWLSKQEFIGLLVLFVLILLLPIAVLEVQRQKNIRSRAEVAGIILINDGATTTTSRDVTVKLTAPWPAAPAPQSYVPPSVGGEKLFSVAYAQQNICTSGATNESCTQAGQIRNVACTPQNAACQVNFQKCEQGKWTNHCAETNCQAMEVGSLQCGGSGSSGGSSNTTSGGSGGGSSSGGGTSSTATCQNNFNTSWPRACDGRSLEKESQAAKDLFCSQYPNPSTGTEGGEAAGTWANQRNALLGCTDAGLRYLDSRCRTSCPRLVDQCLADLGGFTNYKSCDNKSITGETEAIKRQFCFEHYNAESAAYEWASQRTRQLNNCPGTGGGSTNTTTGGSSGGGSGTTTSGPVAKVGKAQNVPESQMNVFPGEAVYLFVVKSDTDNSLANGQELTGCTREFTGPGNYRMAQGDFQGKGNPAQANEVQAEGAYTLNVICGTRTTTARVNVVPAAATARLTQSFRVANTESDLAAAAWQNYTNHPMTIQHRLTDGAGRKTVFVQFRAADGTTSDISSSSITYAPTGTQTSASAIACFAPTSDTGNTLWTVQVQGQNFGSTQGTLVLGSGGSAKTLTVTKWENGVVEGTIARTQMPTSTQTVTVTTSVGQSATIDVNPSTCGQTGPVTLNIKTSLQDKPDNAHGGNFRVVILKKDDRREAVRGQRRFRNSGEMEQSISSLVGGTRYIAWLKASGHLAQQKEFVPTPGDYTLDFSTLTTGDVQEDNQVNVQDYSKLVSEWSKSGDPKSSDADLNVDLRVNTIDYAILLKNFSKDGDGEPVSQ
ncbi:MAG: hypothetical protein Q8R11_03085 [bacterium]|nr:hypothetical protein [bacterium]